jgi:DNA-directed RNA polymerase specialized sigma24 family protein
MVRQLIGPQIRNLKDSVDLTQSLLLNFHQNAMDGKVSVSCDQALDAYLRSMVRHKLANVSDHQKAAKRGGGRQPLSLDSEDERREPPAARPFDPTASMFARVSETIGRLGRALDAEEMAIFRGRIAGRSNVEIAAQLGKTPDAVRMIWVRARAKLVRDGVLEEPE